MMIEIEIQKQLVSRGRSFCLDVAFASAEQFVVLFGPSGSGKTMTLQSIAGLMTPDTGRIVVRDRVLYDSTSGVNLPAKDRGIGYVFQDYALFPHLTAFDNVGFGLKKPGRRRLSPEDRDRVNEFLDIFEIAHLARSLPLDMSGGQKQRVALARALILRPDLVLLDEPFAALDTMLRKRLRKELRKLFQRFNTPIILISHDPEDIRAFADTLVAYDGGRVRLISGHATCWNHGRGPAVEPDQPTTRQSATHQPITCQPAICTRNQ
ncbi:MAG: ATP-binding cassette domain-containing protein [Deltaproteobacteria bacterium]|nr:ATP-binding cassette domain-containing protein [Deltaproteobacteria bacterium]